MALMKCPECGGQVSDQAKACPHCGAPIPHEKKPRIKTQNTRKYLIAAAVVLVVAVIGAAVFFVNKEPVTYPLNMNTYYAASAVPPTDILWETTAEVNGLAGTIFEFDGEVVSIETYPDESGAFIYEDAYIKTDHGMVTVTNLYRSIYNASYNEIGTNVDVTFLNDPVENYVLPKVGQKAHFVGVYWGYSVTKHEPTFVLGASPAIYWIMNIRDPLAKH